MPKFLIEYTSVFTDNYKYYYPDLSDIEIEANNQSHAKEIFQQLKPTNHFEINIIDKIHSIQDNNNNINF